MTSRDEDIRAAQQELESAYRLFHWATDPRVIDEAIARIRAAEMQIDRLTHFEDSPPDAPLPWLRRGER